MFTKTRKLGAVLVAGLALSTVAVSPAVAGDTGICIANSATSQGNVMVAQNLSGYISYSTIAPGAKWTYATWSTPTYGLPFGTPYLHSTSNLRAWAYMTPGAFYKTSSTTCTTVYVKK